MTTTLEELQTRWVGKYFFMGSWGEGPWVVGEDLADLSQLSYTEYSAMKSRGIHARPGIYRFARIVAITPQARTDVRHHPEFNMIVRLVVRPTGSDNRFYVARMSMGGFAGIREIPTETIHTCEKAGEYPWDRWSRQSLNGMIGSLVEFRSFDETPPTEADLYPLIIRTASPELTRSLSHPGQSQKLTFFSTPVVYLGKNRHGHYTVLHPEYGKCTVETQLLHPELCREDEVSGS